MDKLIELLEQMGAENVLYRSDKNAEILDFSFNGKKASIASWLEDGKEMGMEVRVVNDLGVTLSVSDQQPETFDEAGFKALNYTQVGK